MTRRRIVILAITAIIAGGGGFYLYQRFTTPPPATTTRQAVPVQRGTLEATVSANGNITMPHQAKLSFGASGSSSSTVTEVKVKVGDQVSPGQVLAKLDTTSLERTVTSALTNLRTAQINLDKTIKPYTEQDITNAEATVRNAQVTAGTAQRSLEIARSSSTNAQTVRDREYELNYYESRYADAFNQGNRGQDELDRMYNNVLVAREKLAVARQQATNTITNAENDVAKAQDTLSNAQVDLEKKRAGGDPQDIELRRQSLISAQASYQTALDNLERATLTAPFSGTIASVSLKEGEQTTAAANITLVDISVLQVDAILDEIDVAKVKVGQEAVVTLDALPDVKLKATVTTIALVATRQSGVVNYPINLTLTPTDAPVREGMTALATITVTHKENVLLVPNRAIRVVGGQRVVTVLGQTQPRPVRTGLANDQFTEILEGLTDGETVVIETAASTSSGGIGIPGVTGGGGGMSGGVMPSGGFGR